MLQKNCGHTSKDYFDKKSSEFFTHVQNLFMDVKMVVADPDTIALSFLSFALQPEFNKVRLVKNKMVEKETNLTRLDKYMIQVY